MPEGPEVHYFYHSVVATLKGQSLRDVAILSGRYIKHPIILNFRELLESLPQKVIETGVCGKNIWILLENGMSLYFTHGLTGGWRGARERDGDGDGDKYNRIALVGSKDTIYFNDIRNFGTLHVATQKEDLEKKLATLGQDVMSMTAEGFHRFLDVATFQKKPIGLIFLDQHYISGIGNYLRAEILWAAKVSPWKLVKDLGAVEKRALYVATSRLVKYHYKWIQRHKDPHYPNRDKTFQVYMKDVDVDGREVTHEPLGPQTIHWVKERQPI